MNRLIILVIVVLFGICAGTRAHNNRVTRIWVRTMDSAYLITNYDLAHCIPAPSMYCSYWTTTNFGFQSMSDSMFNALLINGYFTGHDFNRRYVF
jgi:hypothetical protein